MDLVVYELEQFLFPKYVAMAFSEALKSWLNSESFDWAEDHHATLSEMETDGILQPIMADISAKLKKEVNEFVIRYCEDRGKTIFESLIAGSLNQEIFATALKIALMWSIQKCVKWTQANAKVSVYEKLTVAFGKTRHKLLLSQRSSGKKERCGSLSPGRFRGLEAPNITAGYSHCIDAIATFSSFKKSLMDKGYQKGHLEATASELSAITAVMDQTKIDILSFPSIQMKSWQDFIQDLMDITVNLVSLGYLCSYTAKDGCHSCRSCLDHLRTLWRKCKDVKLEVPVDKVMEWKAFAIYFEKLSLDEVQSESLWLSLSNVLIALLLDGLTTSAVIEGLWHCRLRQQEKWKLAEKQHLMKACASFLKLWQTFSEPNVTLFKEIHFYRLTHLKFEIHEREISE